MYPAEHVELPENIGHHIRSEDAHGIELLLDPDLLHAVERPQQGPGGGLVLQCQRTKQNRDLPQARKPRKGQDLGIARGLDAASQLKGDWNTHESNPISFS